MISESRHPVSYTRIATFGPGYSGGFWPRPRRSQWPRIARGPTKFPVRGPVFRSNTAEAGWEWLSGGVLYRLLFRRVMRVILVAGALGLLLLGYGKLAGWDITATQEKMKCDGEWAQRDATIAKDYFRGLLPSATAPGIGMFLGFRRRNNSVVSEPHTCRRFANGASRARVDRFAIVPQNRIFCS